MTIQPFNPGNTDNDPDKAYARLEAWLGKVIPLFLKSPEYKKLSKANKKSEGSWFQLFMDFQLNYIGGNLCEFDDEDAAEILIELFPRKVMCSDSQAKTIIPELIAVWQFLQRELNSGQKVQLEFAEDVISFLKGIKRDYLAIFKGEMDAGLDMHEDIFDELMMQVQSEEGGYSWVNGMISEAARNIGQTDLSPTPPEGWTILWDEDALGQFLEHILTIGTNVDHPQVFEAIEEILFFACQNLFMKIRQNDKESIEFWQQTEHNISAAARSGNFLQEPMQVFISVLSQYRQFLSEEFTGFVQHWLKDSHDPKEMSPEDFSLEGLNNAFQNLLDEVPDEFTFVSIVKEQLGFMPADNLNGVIHQLLTLGEQAADALVLMILDQNEQQAVAVASAISEHPKTISAKTLSRLIRIRNWLTPSVQKPIDKLVRDVRKLGIMPETLTAITERTIQEVHMSGVDGAGAQGVMLLVKEGRSFRLISFVFKEKVGVIDVMVTPPETKTELKRFFALAKQQITGLEKVSFELIKKQLPVFLALNLKSNVAIDHELVQAMELLGLTEWNPASTKISTLYADLIPSAPSAEDIESTQKRSGKWTETGVGQSWFSDDKKLQKVVSSSPVKGLYTTICNEVLESDRSLWGERLGRMAVWAQHASSKRRQQQSRDYAVASWLLEHSGFPADEVELLRAIAKNSIH